MVAADQHDRQRGHADQCERRPHAGRRFALPGASHSSERVHEADGPEHREDRDDVGCPRREMSSPVLAACPQHRPLAGQGDQAEQPERGHAQRYRPTGPARLGATGSGIAGARLGARAAASRAPGWVPRVASLPIGGGPGCDESGTARCCHAGCPGFFRSARVPARLSDHSSTTSSFRADLVRSRRSNSSRNAQASQSGTKGHGTTNSSAFTVATVQERYGRLASTKLEYIAVMWTTAPECGASMIWPPPMYMAT